MNDLVDVLLASGSCGLSSYVAVIMANKKDISWLKEGYEAVRKEIGRAHERIDSILREHHR